MIYQSEIQQAYCEYLASKGWTLTMGTFQGERYPMAVKRAQAPRVVSADGYNIYAQISHTAPVLDIPHP
jgi:hypothetical protein